MAAKRKAPPAAPVQPPSPAAMESSTPRRSPRSRVVVEDVAVTVTGVVTPSTPPRKRNIAKVAGSPVATPPDGAATPAKRRKVPPAREARPATPELLAKAERIRTQLAEMFPQPPIPLDHASPFQLLVAVMMSAQTTDLKVNEVTPALFARAPDAATMATLQPSEVEHFIKQVGLAPTKSRNIVQMAKLLLERHGGEVPSTFEELEDLPGVGHKTASVVMAQVFGLPAFPVDTHIHRLAQRWGLTCGASVEQTEADLKAVFPVASWNDLHLQIIFLGRKHCLARPHDPQECPVCCWAAVPPFDRVGASPLKAGQRLVVSASAVTTKKRKTA